MRQRTDHAPREDGLDEGVYFVAFRVSEKMHGGRQPAMGLGSHQFGDDLVFKQGAAQGMRVEVLPPADAHEPAREAGIAEVELLSFEQTLGEVSEPRAHDGNEVGRLEHGDP